MLKVIEIKLHKLQDVTLKENQEVAVILTSVYFYDFFFVLLVFPKYLNVSTRSSLYNKNELESVKLLSNPVNSICHATWRLAVNGKLFSSIKFWCGAWKWKNESRDNHRLVCKSNVNAGKPTTEYPTKKIFLILQPRDV